MVRLACALLLLAVAASTASEDRIMGGFPTTIERYPSMVQIESHLFGLWSQTCAGSILTSIHVLTAARCMTNIDFFVRFRRIRAGSTFRSSGGAIRYAVRVLNHPTYSTFGGNDGDISIVTVQSPLIFSNSIAQARIVAQGSAVPWNAPVTQAGWGITIENFPDIRALTLQEATLMTIDTATCASTYASSWLPRRVTENMLCAAIPNSRVGNCVGDFGGPLYYTDIVVGIISWGYGCTNTTRPSVHTAVSSYTNWIVQNAV